MGLVNPDFGLLFWTLISFSIVLFILGKFAWKPILKSLKDREVSIESALKSAEDAKMEMHKLQADNEKIILEAKSQRDILIREAREVKETIIREAKTEAGAEASKLIKNAREAIENQKAAAITDIKNQVTELSIDIAKKILERELSSPEEQKKFIASLLKQVNPN
ncbi:MAG: F0F1 ATP synthase subunit B [Bacteroidales bacterium]|nr:F0F1 ATP synthase subunit B [Bacteroidales bacterium]